MLPRNYNKQSCHRGAEIKSIESLLYWWWLNWTVLQFYWFPQQTTNTNPCTTKATVKSIPGRCQKKEQHNMTWITNGKNENNQLSTTFLFKAFHIYIVTAYHGYWWQTIKIQHFKKSQSRIFEAERYLLTTAAWVNKVTSLSTESQLLARTDISLKRESQN